MSSDKKSKPVNKNTDSHKDLITQIKNKPDTQDTQDITTTIVDVTQEPLAPLEPVETTVATEPTEPTESYIQEKIGLKHKSKSSLLFSLHTLPVDATIDELILITEDICRVSKCDRLMQLLTSIEQESFNKDTLIDLYILEVLTELKKTSNSITIKIDNTNSMTTVLFTNKDNLADQISTSSLFASLSIVYINSLDII